jgi:hypothetical protein
VGILFLTAGTGGLDAVTNTWQGGDGIWTPEDLNLLLQHLKATLPVDDRHQHGGLWHVGLGRA